MTEDYMYEELSYKGRRTLKELMQCYYMEVANAFANAPTQEIAEHYKYLVWSAEHVLEHLRNQLENCPWEEAFNDAEGG